MIPRHVSLPGHGSFWLMLGETEDILPDEGPLAYEHHCDEQGAIDSLEHALSHSYAHVYANGDIKRYGKVIGNTSQLVDYVEAP